MVQHIPRLSSAHAFIRLLISTMTSLGTVVIHSMLVSLHNYSHITLPKPYQIEHFGEALEAVVITKSAYVNTTLLKRCCH